MVQPLPLRNRFRVDPVAGETNHARMLSMRSRIEEVLDEGFSLSWGRVSY